MIVYDIVMIVDPGHVGSYRPGRWFVEHRDDRGAAEQFAAQCNAARFVDTLHYEVEEHDELSPDRAPLHKSWPELVEDNSGWADAWAEILLQGDPNEQIEEPFTPAEWEADAAAARWDDEPNPYSGTYSEE